MSKKTTAKAKTKRTTIKVETPQWVRVNACPVSFLDFIKYTGHEVFFAMGMGPCKCGESAPCKVIAKDDNGNFMWAEAGSYTDILVSAKPVKPLRKLYNAVDDEYKHYIVTKGTSEVKFVVKCKSEEDVEYWSGVLKQLGYHAFENDGHLFAQYGIKPTTAITVSFSYTNGNR